jgi:hypothetical protein
MHRIYNKRKRRYPVESERWGNEDKHLRHSLMFGLLLEPLSPCPGISRFELLHYNVSFHCERLDILLSPNPLWLSVASLDYSEQ